MGGHVNPPNKSIGGVMKVLKRSIMQDGTEIQIEDWSKVYPCFCYGDTIAAYPKNRYGEKFRVTCDFESNEDAEKTFKELEEGFKTLKEFDFITISYGHKIKYDTEM